MEYIVNRGIDFKIIFVKYNFNLKIILLDLIGNKYKNRANTFFNPHKGKNSNMS